MKGDIEWDEVINVAYTAYNFLQNSWSQDLAFFLMFGRDIYIATLANLLQPNLWYLGDMSSLLSIEILRGLHVSNNKSYKVKRQINL